MAQVCIFSPILYPPIVFLETLQDMQMLSIYVIQIVGKFIIIVLPYLIFVTDATDGVRVNFFWPVKIFTDLTQKIGIFDRFYAKKWRFLQI